MAEDEKITGTVEQAKVTLAQAEAKLRAAKNATERVEAQKLVRAAEQEVKKAEQAVAAPVAAAPAPAAAQVTPPPAAPKVKTHIVQKGESLSLIAKQYYGDIHKWKQLYEANKAVIGDNPDLIKPGQKLVIPD